MDEATALLHDMDPAGDKVAARQSIEWAVENGFTLDDAYRMFGNKLGPRMTSPELPDDLRAPDPQHGTAPGSPSPQSAGPAGPTQGPPFAEK